MKLSSNYPSLSNFIVSNIIWNTEGQRKLQCDSLLSNHFIFFKQYQALFNCYSECKVIEEFCDLSYYNHIFVKLSTSFHVKSLKACLPLINENTLRKQKFLLQFMTNLDNEYQFEGIQLLLSIIKKFDLKEKDYNNETCWHKLSRNLKSFYQKEIFILLLSYLDIEDLNEKDREKNSCWMILFDSLSEENSYSYEILNLLLNFITIKDMKSKNKNENTCWHRLFSPKTSESFVCSYLYFFTSICLPYENSSLLPSKSSQLFSSSQVDILLKLLPLLQEKDLIVKNLDGSTCLHFFFSSFGSLSHLNILNKLLSHNLIKKESMTQKNAEGESCWHLLFSSIQSEEHLTSIKLLFPLLTSIEMKEKNIKGESCWFPLFYSVESSYQIETIRLLLPLLDKEDLKVKNNKGRTFIHNLLDSKNIEKMNEAKTIIFSLLEEEKILQRYEYKKYIQTLL